MIRGLPALTSGWNEAAQMRIGDFGILVAKQSFVVGGCGVDNFAQPSGAHRENAVRFTINAGNG
jgi:hypothetical protein